MAFGGPRGNLTGSGASALASSTATGSVAVSIQDLIVVYVSEITANSVTAVTDNLGGAYTAVNAGTLSTVAGRMFYRVPTAAGTLTTITCTMTASADDYAIVATVFEGPFTTTPLDRAPTNTTDAVTPYTCAATGVLSQANELIVAGMSLTRGNTTTATSPLLQQVNTLSSTANAANSVSASLGYQVVAATTTVTPVFATASGTINGAVQIVATFRQGTLNVFGTSTCASQASVVAGAGSAFTPPGTFILVSGTPANAIASGVSCDVATGAAVNVGDVVVVIANVFTGNNLASFSGASCTKVSGTATIGNVILGKWQDQLGSNGHYHSLVFYAQVLGAGTLTMRVFDANAVVSFISAIAFNAGAGVAYSVEATNGAGVAGTGTNPFGTGNATSAGPAAFLTGCSYYRVGGNTNLSVTNYSGIGIHVADDTNKIMGGAYYHIVTTGTTEQASWLLASGDWGNGVAVSLAVLKAALATNSGDLDVQAATLAGVGVTSSTGTAVVAARASVVAGVGVTSSTGTAVVSAQAATVSGSGTVANTVPVSGFSLVAGTPNQALAGNAALCDVAAGANVSAGDLVIIHAAVWTQGNPYTFTPADCFQISGTATIGLVAIAKHQQVQNNGYFGSVIFYAPVTGSGSLTMRTTTATLGATVYWCNQIAAFRTAAGINFFVESSNGAGGAGQFDGTMPFPTGNATSAGEAVFITGISYGNDQGTSISASPYTTIGEHHTSTGDITGASAYHLVTTGTTEQALWALGGQNNWSAGVVVSIAAFRAYDDTGGVQFRGKNVVAADNGTIVWPAGTQAGDSAVLLLFGNGTLAHVGTGWTQDVNTAQINDQGSNFSVWRKTGLSAGEVSTPFTFTGTTFGGYNLYVASGATGINFITNNAFVLAGTNTLTGFTKNANSSRISTLVIDRTNSPAAITAPNGFNNRGVVATTYFTTDSADIASLAYTNNATVVWTGLDITSASGAVLYEFLAGGAPAAITGTGVLLAGSSTSSGVGVTASTGTSTIVARASVVTGAGVTSSTGTSIITATASILTGIGVTASTGTSVIAARPSVITGAGVTASTGTSVIAATASTLTGVGVTSSTGTSLLTAGASLLTGSGLVTTVGAGIGILPASSATIVGVGSTTLIATGVLTATPAIIAGTGSVRWVTTGVLNDSPAIVTGVGTSSWITTGNLTATPATLTGTGSARWVTTGTLSATPAAVTGVGFVASVGTGVLAPISAVVVGNGALVSTASGVLSAQPSKINATGVVASTGSGVLTTGASTILGTSGPLIALGNGTLTASPVSITGTGVTTTFSFGAIVTGFATVTGSGTIITTSSGTLVGRSSTITGAGALVTAGVGTLIAGASSVTGVSTSISTGTGILNDGQAVVTGIGQVIDRILGTGVLVSGASSLSSHGLILDRLFGSGNLLVGISTLSGDGKVYFDLPGVGVLGVGESLVVGIGAAELDDVPNTVHGVDQDRMTVSSSPDRVETGYPGDRVVTTPSGDNRVIKSTSSITRVLS